MIYIQSNSEQTLPHHFDAACALYGCLDLGIDYKLISYERVMELKSAGTLKNLAKIHPFIGSTEFMTEIWKELGVTPRVPRNSNRDHKTYRMDQVRQAVLRGEKLFVKPFEIKLFTGVVVDQYNISSLKEFKDDWLVMVYDVLPQIIAEWRFYIHNHKIVDFKNYSGDLLTPLPHTEWINNVLKENKNSFPCAYTMDLANIDVTWKHLSGSTVIEYNDMWAIGNYGMPNDLYVRMLKDRYFEIIKK